MMILSLVQHPQLICQQLSAQLYQLLFVNLRMDFERFIEKDDEIGFHMDESDGERLPCDLYDHQSENQYSHSQYTLDQILTIVTQKQGLIDRPISEIVSEAIGQYHMSEQNIPKFVKEIKKNKNILKRNRAKNRNYITQKNAIFQKKEFAFDESSTEKDTVLMEKQIKKQRNRISAQISRDRKKNYVVNLEQKNKQLQSESEILRLENEKLRKQIQQKNIQSNENPKNKQQNKFVRLLIMLGFIFFVYIIKDMFNFKSTKSSSKIAIENEIEECEQEMTTFVSIGEQSGLVEAIKSEIVDMESKQFNEIGQAKDQQNSIKDTAIKKVSQMLQSTKNMMIPAVLAHRLLKVKSIFNF